VKKKKTKKKKKARPSSRPAGGGVEGAVGLTAKWPRFTTVQAVPALHPKTESISSQEMKMMRM
jgi:hypothetical protein